MVWNYSTCWVYHTKTFLEPSGCRTRQPGRSWLLGPGACFVLIQNTRFVRINGTNQTKEGYRVTNPPARSFWCDVCCMCVCVWTYMYVCMCVCYICVHNSIQYSSVWLLDLFSMYMLCVCVYVFICMCVNVCVLLIYIRKYIRILQWCWMAHLLEYMCVVFMCVYDLICMYVYVCYICVHTNIYYSGV